MSPEVSVIIVNHNYGCFLEQTIVSLLGQTLPSEAFEILFIDDASDDDSRSHLKKYKEVIRLWEFEENRGSVAVSNFGFREARGKYIIKVDSDDWCAPTLLERLYKALEPHPITGFSYCDYFEMDQEEKQGRVIKIGKNLFRLLACGVMYSRELLEDCGGYDEDLILPEYDLLLKAKRNGIGAYVPEPLYYYRRHPGSTTAHRERMKLGMNQLEERYGKIPGLTLENLLSPYAQES